MYAYHSAKVLRLTLSVNNVHRLIYVDNVHLFRHNVQCPYVMYVTDEPLDPITRALFNAFCTVSRGNRYVRPLD